MLSDNALWVAHEKYNVAYEAGWDYMVFISWNVKFDIPKVMLTQIIHSEIFSVQATSSARIAQGLIRLFQKEIMLIDFKLPLYILIYTCKGYSFWIYILI